MATYWVTLRLADALPRERMTEVKARAAATVEEEGGDETARKRLLARLIEEETNLWHGDCWLRDEEVARTILASLQSGHGRKYTLRAWCLLPNHLQAVFTVAEGVDAAAVVRDWSNYTTRQVNLLVGREGEELWEKLPYIKACMDDADVMRRIRGVEFRPVNGGLCQRPRDWKWGSARQASPAPAKAASNPTSPSPRPDSAGRPVQGKPTKPGTPSPEAGPEEDPFA